MQPPGLGHHCAPGAVVQARSVDPDALAEDHPATVVQLAAVDLQMPVALQAPLAVEQLPRGGAVGSQGQQQAVAARRQQACALVVQALGAQAQAVAHQLPASVVQKAVVGQQQLIAHHHAALVVQAAGADLHIAVLGLQMAQGVVQMLLDRQGQLAGFGAEYPALVLAEAVEVGSQYVADHLALVVGQVPGFQQQVVLALQQAALVVDVRGVQLKPGGIHRAALVIELATAGEGQLRSNQGASAVIYAGGLEAKQRCGLELATRIDQVLGEAHLQLALLGADHALLAVVQARASDLDLVSQQLAALVEQLCALGFQQGLGLELATVVVQLLVDLEGGAALAGPDQALLVVQPPGADLYPVGNHRAFLVAHFAGLEGQVGARHFQAPAVVVQAIQSERRGLLLAKADQAAQVGDGRGGQHQLVLCQHPGLCALVDQARGLDFDLGPLNHPVLVVQGLARGQLQVAAGQYVAAVLQGAGGQLDLAVIVAAVVGVDSGFDDAVVDHLRGVHHLDPVPGRQAGLHLDLLGGLQGRLGAGVGLALELDALGLDGDGLVGAHAGDRDLAVGVDLDITGAGRHFPGHVHPHALFRAHQADRPGVHAAQGRAVDGQFRLGAGVGIPGRDAQVIGLDVVAPGDDVELLGVQVGIELGTAGDQVELVDVAGVEAGAFDADVAAIDLEAIEFLPFDHRLAGGQGGPWGVDEAAAVAGDAMGVGDDHPGRLPGHFGIARQLAAIAAGDFVENDLGRLPLEVGVAHDVAAQLSVLGRAGTVIEDQAVAADVVFAELVVGQAGAVGGVDVDDGYAIAGRADGGVAPRGRVQGQACGHADDRVEKQDPRQRQGNALGKRLAYVHVRIIHSITLRASQKNRSTRKYTGCSRLSIIAGRSRERAKLTDAARYWPRALSSRALPLMRPRASWL